MVVEVAHPTAGTAHPYPLAARTARVARTTVAIGDVVVGGAEVVVMAGPCAVETEDQVQAAARAVAAAGARVLRGGAFKPRTSPYAFQGLGADGLRLLADAGRANGLPVVTEVVAASDVPLVAEHADALQVGARNVQNFALLKALGTTGRPVLLKRGMSTTIDELLLAAEYVLAHGNDQVILCERGIRSFDQSTRNTLDLAAVPVLQKRTHLPVIVDPSHGTGRRELVTPLARAAVAAGADGLIIEVHPHPEDAWSDGSQSLDPHQFADLMRELTGQAALLGRHLAPPRMRVLPDLPAERAIHGYRSRIDAVDEMIVSLLHERASLGSVLGRLKTASLVPAHVPAREQEVIERATSITDPAHGAAMPADALRRIFGSIVEETRALQEGA